MPSNDQPTPNTNEQEPNIFKGLLDAAPGQPQAQAEATPSAQQGSDEPNIFQGLLGDQAPAPQQQQQQPQATAPTTPDTGDGMASALAAGMGGDTGFGYSDSTADIGAALPLGLAKSGYALKDFFATGAGLWGETPAEGDRSPARQFVDAESARLSDKYGTAYSLTEGLVQGAVGLLGASKVTWGGAAVKAAVGAVGMAAAFEPHAGNVANLVQRVPGLEGPITQFFASNANDSTFEGYAKNALVSLGLEAGGAALFAGTAKLLKALQSGDTEAIQAAHGDLKAAIDAHASEPAQEPATPQPPADTAPQAQSPAPPSPEVAAPTPTLAAPLSDEALGKLLASVQSDTNALTKHGSWDAAIANGHTFGDPDARVPWQKLTQDGNPATSLDAFIARMRDAYSAEIDEAKGGAVQSDAATTAAVNQRVQLWGSDPDQLLGQLQAAGERAEELRADMQAGTAIGFLAHQDAFTLASRINLGEYGEFGNREAAIAALKDQAARASTAFTAAESIASNSARTMRGMRSEFRIDPEAVQRLAQSSLKDADGEALVNLLVATRGDPRALVEATKPGRLAMLRDWATAIQVSGLISGPLTHTVMAASNAVQLLGRPGMRALGSAMTGTYGTVGREAMANYHYMPNVLPDAFRAAVQAFKTADSIIAPHTAADLAAPGGASAAGQAAGFAQQAVAASFVPMNGLGDVWHNFSVAAAKTLSMPPRFVAAQDEFFKQTSYLSQIKAKAWGEGVGKGLSGDALDSFVKHRSFDAFDEAGRATDSAALREAKIATFQNDLNPGTFGWAAQRFLADYPNARFLVPFLRTPINIYRQNWQMTPGLNLAQKEFREALYGTETGTGQRIVDPRLQAQAVGQMTTGGLLMATTGALAYQGLITGAAPPDAKLAGELEATGWRPYSIVIPHGDGSKTYVPIDRAAGAMALPMTMAANIVSILKAEEAEGQGNSYRSESALAAMSLGLFKQLTDPLFLYSYSNTLDAVQNPGKYGAKWAGGMASTFLPFSSALHFVNPDPYLREADGFVSSMLGKVPGFSESLPPRRDWAGEPITVHKGLWLDTPEDRANAEVQRLIQDRGVSVGAPSAQARGGADLRSITMAGDRERQAAGRNAYDYFQDVAGHPPGYPTLKSAVAKLVDSPAYQNSPDGTATTKGTRAWLLADLISNYRKGAMARVSADANVRQAEYAELQRVMKLRGAVQGAPPTQANQTSGMLDGLGKMIGLPGLSGVTPPAK